jgi:hypothetical protein
MQPKTAKISDIPITLPRTLAITDSHRIDVNAFDQVGTATGYIRIKKAPASAGAGPCNHSRSLMIVFSRGSSCSLLMTVV